MKLGFLGLLAATLFGFSANASLDAYAGVYNGKFEGNKGALHIEVNGGTLSAHFMSERGGDDILGHCGSAIGQMTDIDMDGTEVDYVRFAFDSGSCGHIQGRELTVDFKHKKEKVSGAVASVYAYSTWDQTWQCHPLPNGGSNCWPSQQQTDWYATGSFKK